MHNPQGDQFSFTGGLIGSFNSLASLTLLFLEGETWNWAGVGDMSSKDIVGYRGVKLVLKITNPFIKARN
ncbi:hypothetical protein YC2023_060415 [Brassica napus]